MDVAKVARDYFLSSQSSLLIPNSQYGSRKLIHVGVGRSNSAGNLLKHNSNSNINKNHRREEEDDTSRTFNKKSGIFANSRGKTKSLSGVAEESGGREYPWRTVSSEDTADPETLDAEIAEEYAFTSAPSTRENSKNIRTGIPEGERSSHEPSAASKRTNFISAKSASVPALPPPPKPSSPALSSSASPRPRPGSSSGSSGTSGGLKGLLGASHSYNPGVREKSLAMKSGRQHLMLFSGAQIVQPTCFPDAC